MQSKWKKNAGTIMLAAAVTSTGFGAIPVFAAAECFHITPNSALANNTGALLPSIATNSSGQLSFTDEATDLFVLTFVGEPGESITLSLDNTSSAGSYCIVDGKEINTTDAAVSVSAAASSESNEGMTASVKLTMDKVTDFTVSTGDGMNFMPESSITRQDLITLAYRAFLNAGYIEEADDTSSLDEFTDKTEINDYALSPMASMVKAGIIQGSENKVNPKGNATRAEVAVMCARLTALIK